MVSGSVTSQQLAVRLQLGFSAQCALHVFFKIKRLIALSQLKQVVPVASPRGFWP